MSERQLSMNVHPKSIVRVERSAQCLGRHAAPHLNAQNKVRIWSHGLHTGQVVQQHGKAKDKQLALDKGAVKNDLV